MPILPTLSPYAACRYAAAEKDCSVALALDGSYVKAYLRRGVTRACLGRREEAREGELGGAWPGEEGG